MLFMTSKAKPGLGELLRYVGELVDEGAEAQYRAINIAYRARYTPVMRALKAGAETISDITASTYLTQGAISQSVLLMIDDGLLERHTLEDGRKTGVHLTAKGKALLKRLEQHWQVTFAAISELETEIGFPLLKVLESTALALERKGFSARLASAKSQRKGK